jgi:glycosyltransferase involved in cell wall biosynthesis
VSNDRLFRIVYHGTIAKRLGVDLILKAVAKVRDQIPVELWIYGSGDYLEDAVALASELQLDGKVHFSKKFFAVEMISEMLSGMDLGIIGNRRNVACDKFMLPVKLLEYVYLSIPVVAPRLQIITRYFNEGMIKYYDPEDVDEMARCIVELFHDSQERHRLATTALHFYAERNWNGQAEQYLDLLSRPMPAQYRRRSTGGRAIETVLPAKAT